MIATSNAGCPLRVGDAAACSRRGEAAPLGPLQARREWRERPCGSANPCASPCRSANSEEIPQIDAPAVEGMSISSTGRGR